MLLWIRDLGRTAADGEMLFSAPRDFGFRSQLELEEVRWSHVHTWCFGAALGWAPSILLHVTSLLL